MTQSAAPSSPAARRKARRYALQALYQWQLAGSTLSDIEAQFLAANDMQKVDRTYFHDLLHGVPAEVSGLDEALRPFLDRRVEELSQVEKALLRIGAFELKERLDVPYRVVINESIELAKVFDGNVQSGVKRALALLEPVLILFMGVMIAFIIISILMGILSVNDLAI